MFKSFSTSVSVEAFLHLELNHFILCNRKIKLEIVDETLNILNHCGTLGFASSRIISIHQNFDENI